ncbi:type II secretion system F family protein [Pelodictyon luteolum]|uniref:TadB protein n=1 Tax=Chlorobium luteolum (strain DSM 273 / BCRC 81028 / 2530) TaxID=319225 RepID=Q3B549_CHLL3|nr:type II secretion system F family protein [Pelodictyon luteolum]ABB23532.1 TadB protein [Pelodictyon luteolum DSM 273]
MAQYLIPFLAFEAALLLTLLLYWAWARYLSAGSKTKKQRLQTVRDAVHSDGKRSGGMQNAQKDSAIEKWLRGRFKAYVQLENLVLRAHGPLTTRRIMILMSTLFTGVMALGLLRHTHPLLTLVVAAAVAGMPVLWLMQLADRRLRAFEDKLPEALDHISRALRAGHSLAPAMGMVGQEFGEPIGYEFKIVFDEIGFGIPFKEAIGRLAERMQSTDLNFFVISLTIQHETGGNLTELFDGLARTIRHRIKLRGKIRTLSSEGRASGWVLGSMPFVLMMVLSLINPEYISLLWTTSRGNNLMLIGAGLMSVGFVVLKRIVQIKV